MVVLILLSGLAALILLAVLFRRADPLARFAERASARLDQGRVVPTLWGLAASLFLFLACAALFATKILALLGLLLLTADLALVGLGLGVAALSLGLRLAEAGGAFETHTLTALRLGLWTLFLASFLPFVGWLLVILALASGIGAILELVTVRPKREMEHL